MRTNFIISTKLIFALKPFNIPENVAFEETLILPLNINEQLVECFLRGRKTTIFNIPKIPKLKLLVLMIKFTVPYFYLATVKIRKP